MTHSDDIQDKTESRDLSTGREAAKITIIGGFLGSGKTTLLKRFLDWELNRGIRPQVIMSEFGDFDVDGAIIADERLKVAAVVGGCVCCGSRDELADSLTQMMHTAPGSHIYIETTGVADPAGVLEAIALVIKEGTAVIKKIIVVYDASSHNKLERDALLVERQLMAADWIILNKCDLGTEEIEIIASDVSRINPAADMVKTVACAIDPAEVSRGVTSIKAGTNIEDTDGAYRSFAFQTEYQMSKTALEEWLALLPPDVIRVKGIVRLEGEKGFFLVQASRGQNSIVPFPTRRWQNSTIIAITRPRRDDGLTQRLQECVVEQRTERS